MSHTVVHFEIPADDVKRLRAFYTDLFGWKITEAPGMPEYLMIETAPQGQGVNGGMMKRQAPEHKPTNFISVESVDEYAKKVTGLGGQVVMGKTPVPKMGYFAVCLDPDGNSFALWEMNEKAG